MMKTCNALPNTVLLKVNPFVGNLPMYNNYNSFIFYFQSVIKTLPLPFLIAVEIFVPVMTLFRA